MSVDKEDVRKVAKLARLSVGDERLVSLTAELNGILKWIEQLEEVDISNVEPMTSVVHVKLPMRDDELQTGPTGGGQPDNVVANAPKTEDHFFVVPKVVE